MIGELETIPAKWRCKKNAPERSKIFRCAVDFEQKPKNENTVRAVTYLAIDTKAKYDELQYFE